MYIKDCFFDSNKECLYLAFWIEKGVMASGKTSGKVRADSAFIPFNSVSSPARRPQVCLALWPFRQFLFVIIINFLRTSPPTSLWSQDKCDVSLNATTKRKFANHRCRHRFFLWTTALRVCRCEVFHFPSFFSFLFFFWKFASARLCSGSWTGSFLPPSVLIDRHATRIPFSPPKHLTMFQSPFTSSSSCNFRSIFVAALKDYERKTKTDLHLHPLATQLHSCKSSSDILAVLHDKVNELDQSKSCSERLSSWLNPTVKVLYAFSTALGEEVGLVSLNWSAGPLSPLNCFLQILSPTQIISVGIGVLLLVGIFLSPFLEGF
jgi:hypothetical protein